MQLNTLNQARFELLNDHDAEGLNGGFWFSSTITKSASTSLSQTNNSTNLGVGAVFGAGIATSTQGNLAYIGTSIG